VGAGLIRGIAATDTIFLPLLESSLVDCEEVFLFLDLNIGASCMSSAKKVEVSKMCYSILNCSLYQK
jgi:hypothetical protein